MKASLNNLVVVDMYVLYLVELMKVIQVSHIKFMASHTNEKEKPKIDFIITSFLMQCMFYIKVELQ